MSPSAVVPIRLSNLLINRSGSGEVLGEEERNISTQAKYSRRKAKSQKGKHCMSVIQPVFG